MRSLLLLLALYLPCALTWDIIGNLVVKACNSGEQFPHNFVSVAAGQYSAIPEGWSHFMIHAPGETSANTQMFTLQHTARPQQRFCGDYQSYFLLYFCGEPTGGCTCREWGGCPCYADISESCRLGRAAVDGDIVSFVAVVPPSAPPPPSFTGAILELTGDRPKIKFGPPDDPVCELALDETRGRLESTCEIATASSGRRLAGNDFAYSLEIASLKAEVAEMRRTIAKLTSTG